MTLVNLLDEALLLEADRRGGVDDVCVERMASLIGPGQEAGASAVVVTCNAYSGAVDQLATRFDPLWVVSIDQVLVDNAISRAVRIGVVGTVAVGLK